MNDDKVTVLPSVDWDRVSNISNGFSSGTLELEGKEMANNKRVERKHPRLIYIITFIIFALAMVGAVSLLEILWSLYNG